MAGSGVLGGRASGSKLACLEAELLQQIRDYYVCHQSFRSSCLRKRPCTCCPLTGRFGMDGWVWVAVKELNLGYYIGETLLFTIYTHCGNLI